MKTCLRTPANCCTKDAERAELEAHPKARRRNENALEADQDEQTSEAAASNSMNLSSGGDADKQLQSRQQESSMESAMIEAAEETATMRNN